MIEALGPETTIRLGAFLGVLGAMGLWESVAPRRRLGEARSGRWPVNLGLSVLDALLIRLLLPAAALGAAVASAEQGFGLFHRVGLTGPAAWVLGVVALDLVIYLQHVMFHAVPALWRVHRVHHTDLDFDVTTAVRFHPLEILLSMGIKVAAVAVLGPPVVAVLIFEVLLNATSMFNHGNVRLPRSIDRVLRWVLVTPDMHRVHHSVVPAETNSNFGFNLPWWDRLLGTYRDQPKGRHESMPLGLEAFQERRHRGLGWLLLLPFR